MAMTPLVHLMTMPSYDPVPLVIFVGDVRCSNHSTHPLLDLHHKKRLASFPSPARMSLTKLSPTSWLETGMSRTFFYSVQLSQNFFTFVFLHSRNYNLFHTTTENTNNEQYKKYFVCCIQRKFIN